MRYTLSVRAYISYTWNDRQFAVTLARALAGAGASVAFDPRVSDAVPHGNATWHAMRAGSYLIFVLSPAALASARVESDLVSAHYWYRQAHDIRTNRVEHLKRFMSEHAAAEEQAVSYPQLIFVIAEALDPSGIDESWALLREMHVIAGADYLPIAADKAIERTLEVVAQSLPSAKQGGEIALFLRKTSDEDDHSRVLILAPEHMAPKNPAPKKRGRPPATFRIQY